MIEKDKYFLFEDLANYDNVVHFFSKKPLNFYERVIKKSVILDNYNNIKKEFNLNYRCIKDCKQSHTDNIVILDDSNIDENYFENADGIITNLKDIALVTYFADCQPILLYDPVNNVIGNIHSGWRGTSKKIIVNAINIMVDKFSCDISNIRVYFGPSILQCCFEVDDDVFTIFKDSFDNIDKYIKKGRDVYGSKKYYIDTVGINSMLLLENGVKKGNIFYSNICTKCNYEKIFSYRSKDGNVGRNISLICLKNKDIAK